MPIIPDSDMESTILFKPYTKQTKDILSNKFNNLHIDKLPFLFGLYLIESIT